MSMSCSKRSLPDLQNQDRQITFTIKGKGERFFRQKSVPTVFEDGRKGHTIILEDITGRIIADRENPGERGAVQDDGREHPGRPPHNGG